MLPNGKVNRKALPDPMRTDASAIIDLLGRFGQKGNPKSDNPFKKL